MKVTQLGKAILVRGLEAPATVVKEYGTKIIFGEVLAVARSLSPEVKRVITSNTGDALKPGQCRIVQANEVIAYETK